MDSPIAPTAHSGIRQTMKRLASVCSPRRSSPSAAPRRLLLVALLILINVEVVARYVFGRSTLVADEYGGYLMAWITMLGAVHLLRADRHLTMTWVVDRLSPRGAERGRHRARRSSASAISAVLLYATYAARRRQRAVRLGFDPAFGHAAGLAAAHPADRLCAAVPRLRGRNPASRAGLPPRRNDDIGERLWMTLAAHARSCTACCSARAILIGVPVVAAMSLVGIVGITLLHGTLLWPSLGDIVWNTVNSFTLTAVPLFVLMGEIILRSGASSRFYQGVSVLLNRVAGQPCAGEHHGLRAVLGDLRILDRDRADDRHRGAAGDAPARLQRCAHARHAHRRRRARQPHPAAASSCSSMRPSCSNR